MKAEVVLINPNQLHPAIAPLALDYLADTLEAAGIGVRMVDLCFETDPESALAAALGSKETLVGLSLRNTDDCYLAGGKDFLPGHLSIAQMIKQHSKAPLVLGGSGYSVCPEPILNTFGADFGIAGEGEIPLALLTKALAENRPDKLAEVPGLIWQDGNGIKSNATWVGPLDMLSVRRRALLDNKRYFEEGGQAGIETKRGCDRKCIYCADPLGKGRRVRARTPKQVADEFEVLLDEGVHYFHLCDSEFNVPAEHAAAVCEELIGRGMGDRARWYTYATPAGFTPQLAQMMRQAGCLGINFGVDSGDDRMLVELGRDFTASDLWQTAPACRSAGLVCMYDLLLGGPGETRESLSQTIEMMKKISPDRVGVSLGVRIYRGTELSKLVMRQGPMPLNPNLRGAVKDNPHFLAPVYYLSSELREDAASYVAGLVGGDQRFFFPTYENGAESYNYRDNDRLVAAIKKGYRGAYWDILRRLQEEASVK